MTKGWSIILLCVISLSCSNEKVGPKLQLTEEQIVYALVEMYSVNAALNLNDVSYRDSTAAIYYRQIEKSMGLPMSKVRADFEQLLLYPDSLVRLENRALDTIRVLLEKNPGRNPIIIGKN